MNSARSYLHTMTKNKKLCRRQKRCQQRVKIQTIKILIRKTRRYLDGLFSVKDMPGRIICGYRNTQCCWPVCVRGRERFKWCLCAVALSWYLASCCLLGWRTTSHWNHQIANWLLTLKGTLESGSWSCIILCHLIDCVHCSHLWVEIIPHCNMCW